MHGFARRSFDLPENRHTPPDVFFNSRGHRREFLADLGRGLAALGSAAAGAVGLTAAGLTAAGGLQGCAPSVEEVTRAGRAGEISDVFSKFFPAPRNGTFTYGRAETEAFTAARFTNFYEFSTSKESFRYVDAFEPYPWAVAVEGLCSKPRTFDLDDLYALAPLEERAYRMRCVETWAMCVPWTGFPLKRLLEAVEPAPSATHVVFESFLKPDQARQQRDESLPWPYREGLTIAEAGNDLVLLALGVYGAPLPKQHGAPARIVVPWKYGFKGAKSVVRIVLTDQQPETFWNTLTPHEYPFEANVDPAVPHPRWSQAREWMLGTREAFDTVKYNGYGDDVARLYES